MSSLKLSRLNSTNNFYQISNCVFWWKCSFNCKQKPSIHASWDFGLALFIKYLNSYTHMPAHTTAASQLLVRSYTSSGCVAKTNSVHEVWTLLSQPHVPEWFLSRSFSYILYLSVTSVPLLYVLIYHLGWEVGTLPAESGCYRAGARVVSAKMLPGAARCIARRHQVCCQASPGVLPDVARRRQVYCQAPPGVLPGAARCISRRRQVGCHATHRQVYCQGAAMCATRRRMVCCEAPPGVLPGTARCVARRRHVCYQAPPGVLPGAAGCVARRRQVYCQAPPGVLPGTARCIARRRHAC